MDRLSPRWARAVVAIRNLPRRGLRLGYFVAVALAQVWDSFGLFQDRAASVRMPDYKVGGSGAAYNALFAPVTFLIVRVLIGRTHVAKREKAGRDFADGAKAE